MNGADIVVTVQDGNVILNGCLATIAHPGLVATIFGAGCIGTSRGGWGRGIGGCPGSIVGGCGHRKCSWKIRWNREVK